MREESVLVDSSVWIEASRTKSKESKKLKEILFSPKEIIYTARIIQLEVSQGASSASFPSIK